MSTEHGCELCVCPHSLRRPLMGKQSDIPKVDSWTGKSKVVRLQCQEKGQPGMERQEELTSELAMMQLIE